MCAIMVNILNKNEVLKMNDIQKFLIKQYVDIMIDSEIDANPHTINTVLSQVLSTENKTIVHALNASSLVTQLETLLADDNAQYTLFLLRRGDDPSQITAAEVHAEIRRLITEKIKEMQDIILPYQDLKAKYLKVLSVFPIISNDEQRLENIFKDIKKQSAEVRTLFYQDLVKQLVVLEDSLLQQPEEAPTDYIVRVEETLINNIKVLNTKKNEIRDQIIKEGGSKNTPVSAPILKPNNSALIDAWLNLLRTNQWRKASEAFQKLCTPNSNQLPGGVSIDTQDQYGNTALYYALRFGDVLLAKSLLEDFHANPKAYCIQKMKQDLPIH